MKNIAVLLVTLGMASCVRSVDSSAHLTGGQGTIIDNGGDKIRCRADVGSEFAGEYALDYLMTYDAVNQQDPSESSWEALAERTTRILRQKAPAEMAASWERYLADFMQGSPSGVRIWHASTLSLSDLQDEGQLALIPEHCKVLRGDREVPDLVQMVRRRYLNDDGVTKVHYYYDHRAMADFAEELPLQYSYIAVHEWLWDYADTPWSNRSINHLIHSRQAESLSPDQFKATLRSFGVDGGEGGFVGSPGRVLERLRAIFEARPECDFTKRLTAEFSDVGRVVVAGGSKFFTAQLQDPEQRLGGKICGQALVTDVEPGGDVSVNLRAGSFGVTQRATGGEFVAYGVCVNDRCRHREGPLGPAIFPQNFTDVSWTLEVSASRPTVMVSPRLVFIGARQ